MKMFVSVLIIVLSFFSINSLVAQESFCLTSFDTFPPLDSIPPITPPTMTCASTPDSIFFRSFIGDKANYIPYANSYEAQNVKKKIKVKFVVIPPDTLNDFYKISNIDSFNKIVAYANGILNDINIPSKPATNICGDCHIEKAKFQIELVDVVFENEYMNIGNYDDRDSILHVFFEKNEINSSYGRASLGKKNSIHSFAYLQIEMFNQDLQSSMYECSRLLLHEIGHLFGLKHLYIQGNQGRETCDENDADYLTDILNTGIDKWCTDDNPHGFLACEPFDPSTLCTNNIMDNRMWGYLSPMQLGIMHRSSYIGSIHQYIYPTETPKETPWLVNNNQVWNFGIRLYQDLIIKSGNTLTITCELQMAPDARILVEKGAKLIINGGHITSYNKSSKWAGIELVGDKSQPPTSQYQGTLEMINDGIIENAMNGVRNFTFDNGAQGGGIIKIKDSEFLNCRRAVELNDYSNFSYLENGISNCYFNNVSFVINDTQVYANTSGAIDFFTAYNILGGIQIENCHFENQLTLDEKPQMFRNDAIFLLSSHAYITQSQFIGFRRAIKNNTHTNTPNRSVSIIDNEFKYNTDNINLLNTANNRIRSNKIYEMIHYFDKDVNLRSGNGVFLKNTINTIVNCENTIEGPTDGRSPYNESGIITENTFFLYGNNVIKNNTLKNLTNGYQAQKYNIFVSVSCNDFENNKYALNINPESQTYPMGDLGSGCEFADKRADNIFSNNDLDIISYVTNPWNYYHSNQTQFTPNHSNTFNVVSCSGVGGNTNCDNFSSCMSVIEIPDFNSIQNMIATYMAEIPIRNHTDADLIALKNTIVNNLIVLNKYDDLIDFYKGLNTQESFRALMAMYYEKNNFDTLNFYIDSLSLSSKEKDAYRNYYNFLKSNIESKLPGEELSSFEEQFLLDLINEEYEVSIYAKSLLSWYKEEEYWDFNIEKNLTPISGSTQHSYMADKTIVQLKNAFPNPSSEVVHIEFVINDPLAGNLSSKLVVYDMHGKIMYQEKYKGNGVFLNTINTETWNQGVYIYELSLGNQAKTTQTKKFIISK